MFTFISSVRATVASLAIFTVLCCGVYPLSITAVSALAFPVQSTGSLLKDKAGTVVGSSLIGQNFSQPQYFWGRLSATSDAPYNAKVSSGSNLGVNNPALLDAVKTRMAALGAVGGTAVPVPVDLVTASASGLDPEISPAAATYQVARIAKAHNISEDTVRSAIMFATRDRSLGFLGEPGVNVLLANLKLDGRL